MRDGERRPAGGYEPGVGEGRGQIGEGEIGGPLARAVDGAVRVIA